MVSCVRIYPLFFLFPFHIQIQKMQYSLFQFLIYQQMEYNQGLMQRHLIENYPYHDRNHYHMLNKEGSPNHRLSSFQQEEYYNESADEQKLQVKDCFPDLLGIFGICCIPFKFAFPCLFCSCCMCRQTPLYKQQTGTLGLLQEWGMFRGYLSPGLNILNPASQSVLEISLQTQVVQYEQEGISKDNVHLKLSVSIMFRVIDGFKFAYRLASSPTNCISQMAAGNLRSIIGRQVLQEIIQNQIVMREELKEQLNKQLSYWGLYVQACLLKEIKLDQEMRKLLETVIIKKKNIEAMLIDFRSDVQAGKLMKEIANIINSTASFQMRYLKTVENIVNNGNEMIVILKMTSQF